MTFGAIGALPGSTSPKSEHMLRSLLLAVTLITASAVMVASPGPQPKKKALPKVFVLGEYESDYESLVMDYQQSLLTACDCTMKEAFAKWLGMLHELDVYAKNNSVDIRGVKVWLHVFWNPDGTVDHIAYHLRPNSRDIEADAMTALLDGFTKTYSFPMTSEAGFQHYSTGSFPVFGELASDK